MTGGALVDDTPQRGDYEWKSDCSQGHLRPIWTFQFKVLLPVVYDKAKSVYCYIHQDPGVIASIV